MTIIDSKKLEKLRDKHIENYKLSHLDLIKDLSNLIEPKTEFVKGEIVEFRDKRDGVWYIAEYGKDSKSINNTDCRKLDSIPLVPIKHDYPSKPKDLEYTNIVAIHYKGSPKNIFHTKVVNDINWTYVDLYIKIHFICNEGEK